MLKKTEVFFGGYSDIEATVLADTSGFSLGSFPTRYLGLPLNPGRISMNILQPFIDKITTKLHSWTVKYLSFAGKVTMVASVIYGLVNFWSSVFVLPKSFYAKIDSLCAAFLWNNTTTSASGARVSWSDLCRPKAEGGLGIRLLEEYQEVFRLKRTWNYLSNNNSLWVGWVKNNVFHWSSFWVMADTPRFPPAIRSMIQLKPQLTNLLRCVLGNGETASFWYDSWTPLGPLIDLVGHGGRSTMRIREDTRVCEAVRDGEWYLPGARSDARQQMQIILTTIQPPAASDEPDKYLWIKSDGSYGNKFSTRVTWKHIRQRAAPVFWSKVVWFREYIPRCSFMSWLALHRRLPTKDRMRRWGMEVSETCVLCSTGIETHHHLFFECTYSSSVWLYFASQIRSFPPMDLHSAAAWILSNQQQTTAQAVTILKIIYQAYIYLLWKKRNARIFTGISTSAEGLKYSIDRLVRARLVLSSHPSRSCLSSPVLFLLY
ncbi:hypothetical protein YC2023_052636 [Brassica napus]